MQSLCQLLPIRARALSGNSCEAANHHVCASGPVRVPEVLIWQLSELCQHVGFRASFVNAGTVPHNGHLNNQCTRRSTCADDDFGTITETTILPPHNLWRWEVLADNQDNCDRWPAGLGQGGVQGDRPLQTIQPANIHLHATHYSTTPLVVSNAAVCQSVNGANTTTMTM